MERSRMENPMVQNELRRSGGLTERLRDARTRANLQGRQLAQRTGWAPSKVSKLEMGQQVPTAEDVYAWLTACGSAASELRVAQAEVERIRKVYPELQEARRERDRAVSAYDIGAAYRRGFEDAVRKMRRALESFEPDEDPGEGAAADDQQRHSEGHA